MGTVARTYGPATANPVATGSTILAAHVNTDLDTIYSEFNGNIANANIHSSAAIAISKTTLGTFTDWTADTPTIAVSGGTAPDYTAQFSSRYMQIGKLVVAAYTWRNTAGGTAGVGGNPITITYPGSIVPSISSGTIGNGLLYEGAGTITPVVAIYNSATTFTLLDATTYTSLTGADQSSTARAIRLILFYETA